MRVQVDKVLKDNSYNVTLSILDFNIGNYMEAIHDFGEKAINFGGNIEQVGTSSENAVTKMNEGTTEEPTNPGETTPTEPVTTILAVLADNTVKISDMVDNPISQSFNTMQYGENAEMVANAWATQSVAKIDAYVKEMCAKIDTFTGTQIIDV